MQNMNWEDVYQDEDLDSATNKFLKRIENENNNSKKLWQTINEITTNSETVKIASMKNKDNEIINNPTEIKSFYIPFSSYESSLPSYNLNVQNDFKILPAKKIKYLGIIIDNHLRWNTHPILDHKQMKLVYQSLVEPHLRYGIIGWDIPVTYYITRLKYLISVNYISYKYVQFNTEYQRTMYPHPIHTVTRLREAHFSLLS
ncbi:hypothetical protein NQ317_019304 [Molorchus minor]|uniref:Uncharacterized protein n=1 Tax=Molorchus minor TaxID=1323400 RepID=A0ABQ9JPW0_9CUCU|nr:hypothetical protein NQ317_019304 [Molorchus minor]